MVLLQASRMVVQLGRRGIAWSSTMSRSQMPQRWNSLTTAQTRQYTATTTRRDNGETEASGIVHVSISEARSTTAQALENLGWDTEDAALQAEIMTAAELCGNNQGKEHITNVQIFDLYTTESMDKQFRQHDSPLLCLPRQFIQAWSKCTNPA